jgi:peptidoglycan/xylan/chitin deacetylase (PgdA/CDA1 family)
MDLLIRQRFNKFTTSLAPAKPVRNLLTAPIASITFDDFPKSAWTVGGPILARYGVKATYYATGRFCGVTEDGLAYYDVDDLRAVRAAGHEVGCHTYGHDLGSRFSTTALREDIDRNRQLMAELIGQEALSSFAYPYGDASPRTRAVLAELFPTSRGIRAGVNSGVIDLAQLKSVEVSRRRWNPVRIDAYIARTTAQNGWLTFFTHDVSEDPTSYGCTPAMLEHVLEALQRAGIPVLTVEDALARVTLGAG